MRYLSVGAAVLFVLILGLRPELLQANDNDRSPTSILFLGSSYFGYNDLPGLFQALADSAGHDVYIDQRIPSGLYLSDHAASAETAALIQRQRWDYVVLQGVGRGTAYPESFTDHPVYPALATLCDMIHDNDASTQVVFCLPWAFEDGMTWYQGWTDTFVEMQNHIYDNTLQYAEDLDFAISPVGSAWKTVLDDCGYPLHYLHLSDWNHPSLRGSYLMACTIFTTLFLESTNGIGDATQLPVEELVHFQTVATRTVLNDLALWKIPAPSTEVPDVTGWSGFRLRQSCPNPFNPTTVIAFDAPCEAAVRLSIHDVSGRLVDLLLDDRIVPQGRNEVVWQGRDSRGRQVPSGTYFYRLEAGPYQETKCMTLLK